jgi:hypothetical protein
VLGDTNNNEKMNVIECVKAKEIPQAILAAM